MMNGERVEILPGYDAWYSNISYFPWQPTPKRDGTTGTVEYVLNGIMLNRTEVATRDALIRFDDGMLLPIPGVFLRKVTA